MFTPDSPLQQLTIRYFEKGHTFMSADSFHHLIEDQIRSRGKLNDFNDYVVCVDDVVIAVEMQPSDFLDLRNHQVQRGK